MSLRLAERMAVTTGAENAFVSMLRRHPRFAVGLVDLLVQKMSNHFRRRLHSKLQQYAPWDPTPPWDPTALW